MRGRWIWAYLHRQKKHLRFLNRGVIFSEPSCKKNNPAQDTKPTTWETGGDQWGQGDIKAVQQGPDAEGMDQSGSWVKKKKRVWAIRGKINKDWLHVITTESKESWHFQIQQQKVRDIMNKKGIWRGRMVYGLAGDFSFKSFNLRWWNIAILHRYCCYCCC